MNDVEISNCSQLFQKKLRDFYEKNKEECCDLTFIVEEKRIKAQRYVLASMSEVFQGMLYGGMSESKTNEITITDCEHPASFKYLIEFCMTGYVKCPLDQAIPLLFLSEKYLVTEMKDQLSRKIIKMITPENSFEIYKIAKTLNIEPLVTQCLSFFKLDPFKTILSHPNLPTLTRESFVEMLELANFTSRREPGDEIKIAESIVRWSREKEDIGENKNYEEVEGEEEEEERESRDKNFQSHSSSSLSSSLILKYVDFRKLQAKDILKVQKMGFDPSVLLQLVLYTKDKKIDVSEFLPEECATLSTLTYNGRKMHSFFETGTCIERNRIGCVDLQYILNDSMDSEASIDVPFKTTHDGGCCYDPSRNMLWSHFGQDGVGNNSLRGRKLYCTDLTTNKTTTVNIPFPTHGSYPCYDPKRELVFVCEGESSHQRFGCFNVVTNKFKELKKTIFTRKNFCCNSIHFDRLWSHSRDNRICYYDIEKEEWVKLKDVIVNDAYISFHEFEGSLWIVSNSAVYKLSSIEEKLHSGVSGSVVVGSGSPTILESMDLERVCMVNNFTPGGNFISFSLLTKEGSFVVCLFYKNWIVVDPIQKRQYTLNWSCRECDCPGFWFLRSSTMDLFFNLKKSWRKVSLFDERMKQEEEEEMIKEC